MRDCLELLVLLTLVSYASVTWSKGNNLMWWMRSNFGPYQSWLSSPEEFNSSHLGPTKIKPGFGYFQIVGSGILHIVMHGNPDEGSLLKVLEPLLSRLSHSSWTALDVNVMWNCKRPVWFQVRTQNKCKILRKDWTILFFITHNRFLNFKRKFSGVANIERFIIFTFFYKFN